MRTSYSALDTYKQCPQKYKFQEIDRVPATRSQEAVFGTVVHDALKFMFARDPLYPTIDQVLGYFRANFDAKSGGWDNFNRETYANEGLRMIKNFYARNAPWNFSVVDLESKFEVLIADEASGETHILAGKIDRIDKVGDGAYEIIDYKTARKLPPQEKIDRDFQLSIYSLGLQRKWPHLDVRKIKLSLYFLKHGEKLSTMRTEEDIAATKGAVLSSIREISKKVANGDRFEPNPSPLCDWCPYKAICPAWKHLYRRKAEGPLQADEMDQVLKEYFELIKQKDAAEDKMAELKGKIREYMEQEGLDRLFGDDGYITRSVQKRYSFDSERVREILEPLGLWHNVLKADEQKIKAALRKLPPHVCQKINEARLPIKEFTVLTTSMKKINMPGGGAGLEVS